MKTEKRRGPGSQEILRLEAGRRKWQRRLGSSRSLRKGECDVLKARRGKTIKECAEIQYSELNAERSSDHWQYGIVGGFDNSNFNKLV